MVEHVDVAIIGSGFGGSVSALRLVEKGYRVAVFEAGRRFADDEFAATSWHVRDYLFAPRAGCYGIFRITPLRNVLVLTGAGVGGGSLGYANTLYRPSESVYADRQWAGITDWQRELAPYYDQAERMLGVETYPRTSPADEVIAAVAADMGVGHTVRRADVGVFFGTGRGHDAAAAVSPGTEVPDPYFGGEGPPRRACLHCGECMTGCRHNAKNTLVKNYLHLAERGGAQVHPLTTVTDVRPRDNGGYTITTRRTDRRRAVTDTVTADQVIFAAGALGTARLLHRLRRDGSLPALSDRVGHLTRTNSEAILAARTARRDVDYTEGVAITSSMHTDDHTHIEPVRYGKGSNLLALMGAVLVDGDQGRPRWRTALREIWRQRRTLTLIHDPRHWSEQSIVVLVMQSLDNSITTRLRRRGRGLTSSQGAGDPNPSWIPAGHEVTRRVAQRIGGVANGAVGDLVDVPTTGHLIGGCVVGESPRTGVVDGYHRVFGHDGLHIVDGSSVPVNLGVNPSLTITAMAERAMSMWPNRGQADPRPAAGAAYLPVPAVPPERPVVPAAAPGALRLPVIERPTPSAPSTPSMPST